MYRTYQLTSKEEGKPFLAFWDGDCMIYSVFDDMDEYNKEKDRIERIENEAKKKYQDYLDSLKEV